jgi:hypothetical protein
MPSRPSALSVLGIPSSRKLCTAHKHYQYRSISIHQPLETILQREGKGHGRLTQQLRQTALPASRWS